MAYLKQANTDKVSMKIPNGHRAHVPIEKLRDYCLNPMHHVDGNKAHVFESVLGLTGDDVEKLEETLYVL